MPKLIAPWNATWTSEDRYEVRACRWADGMTAIWQPHSPGEGKPIFAKPHVVRSRRAVAECLCSVCGEFTPVSDRWWFRLGQTDMPGWAFATTEPPVHRACADLALKVCPHLRRAGKAPVRWDEPDGIVPSFVYGMASGAAGKAPALSARQRVVGPLNFVWDRLPSSMRGVA